MANSTDAEATLKKFVARINAHDPSGIIALCTIDHVFIDSLGSRLSGHEQLAQRWRRYFSLFPDYCIEVESAISRGTLLLTLVSPRRRTRHRNELAHSSRVARQGER